MIRFLSGKKKTAGGIFELNIVPIVDCMTILVLFLLSAGVYYSVAMLDVKVSGGAAQTQPERKAITVTVELQRDLGLILKVTGTESRNLSLQASKGQPDTADLDKELEGLKTRYPNVATATLVANREVDYQNVVSVMESIRKTHPDVMLGGF